METKRKAAGDVAQSPAACLLRAYAILVQEAPKKRHSMALGNCADRVATCSLCYEAPFVDEPRQRCHTTIHSCFCPLFQERVDNVYSFEHIERLPEIYGPVKEKRLVY